MNLSEYLENQIYNESIIDDTLLGIKNIFKKGMILVEDITSRHKVVYKIDELIENNEAMLIKVGDIFSKAFSPEKTKRIFQKELNKYLRKPKKAELQIINENI